MYIYICVMYYDTNVDSVTLTVAGISWYFTYKIALPIISMYVIFFFYDNKFDASAQVLIFPGRNFL